MGKYFLLKWLNFTIEFFFEQPHLNMFEHMMGCRQTFALASSSNWTFNLQLTANWGQIAWIISFANKGVVLCVQPFISPDKSSHIIWIIAMVWCWQNDRGLCPHVPAELVSVCWLSAGSVQQEHEWSPSATSALSSNQNAGYFGILQSECSILRHPPISTQYALTHRVSMKCASPFLVSINICHHWI